MAEGKGVWIAVGFGDETMKKVISILSASLLVFLSAEGILSHLPWKKKDNYCGKKQ